MPENADVAKGYWNMVVYTSESSVVAEMYIGLNCQGTCQVGTLNAEMQTGITFEGSQVSDQFASPIMQSAEQDES